MPLPRIHASDDAIRGAPDSRHLVGQAADIEVKNFSPKTVYTLLDELHYSRFGLGRYSGHVHIDVRRSKDCKPWIFVEPSGKPTDTGMMSGSSESLSNDGQLWVVRNNQQATPTESLYVWFDKLPKKLIFGAAAGPRYEHSFEIA